MNLPKTKKLGQSRPNIEQIKTYINSTSKPVTRRDVARAFKIKGSDRIWLKKTLRELTGSGEVTLSQRRGFSVSSKTVPSVSIIEIIKVLEDGDLLGKLKKTNNETARIKILISYKSGTTALQVGDHVLAKIQKSGSDVYNATVMRRIERKSSTAIGIITKTSKGMKFLPIDGRRSQEAFIQPHSSISFLDGDIVKVEFNDIGRSIGRKASVLEKFGNQNNSQSVSLISIHEHEIPTEFSAAAIDLATNAKPAMLDDNRKDIRNIDLITIDGSDARDFDDAVWAEKDQTKNNKDGWRIIVAIADVAHYVKPDDALDVEARKRGNSVYFPDRVVPMLPEALSNGMCSLRPNEDRACLAVQITIDNQGKKLSHKFFRALMRSKARVTYEDLQSTFDSKEKIQSSGDFIGKLAIPLYGAFNALHTARLIRGALDIEVPEMQVQLGTNGDVENIKERERLDSHRLIEEFMVLANVCAAETLEEKKYACVYRVHDVPSSDKINGLRVNLEAFGIKLNKGQVVTSKLFNEVLKKAANHDAKETINQLVLRSQSQAIYSSNNLGHFGLGLRRYAHFTSPIRRYSDLLVHRALILAHNYGKDGGKKATMEELEPICEAISLTERRAAVAERSANDRYSAGFMAQKLGESFDAIITSVMGFGVFVRLDNCHADALLPVRSLPYDYYEHDDKRHTLTGRNNGMVFSLGEKIPVTLKTADPITGRLAVDYAGGLPENANVIYKKTSKTKNRRQKFKKLPKH